MTYKIKRFNKTIGQLIVEFDELQTEIAIDLPIENNQYISEEHLDTYIRGFIPEWTLKRKQIIEQGVDNENVYVQLAKRSDEEELNERKEQARLIRDQALTKCDWVMLPDTGFSKEQVDKFKIYRQQLRDVPQQPGFPDNVIWPSVTGEWPNHPSWK